MPAGVAGSCLMTVSRMSFRKVGLEAGGSDRGKKKNQSETEHTVDPTYPWVSHLWIQPTTDGKYLEKK